MQIFRIGHRVYAEKTMAKNVLVFTYH